MKEQRYYFWLSTAAAITTICLKTIAWQLTASIGLASDAMESFANLAGATFALWMITIAKIPPDEDHPLGHSKAEYFSSGFEGLLILGAACVIIWSATERFFNPKPLEALGIGLLVSAGASVINLIVAISMNKAARRYRSIALEGGARHLISDVWTSAAVILGVMLVNLTGWLWLDSAAAILVGAHILTEGWKLLSASAHGLMDAAINAEDLKIVHETLERLGNEEIRFTNLRTRRAGSRNFVYLDVQVPGQWSVRKAHAAMDVIEDEIAKSLPETVVFTHAEPAPE